ncbi:MAG TPA: nitrate reductase [Coleofasciculaceae cyanobacterium]
MSEPIKTLCPYCGVGCGLEVLPPAQPGKSIQRDNQGNPLWQVRGDRSHPSSKGKICVKGGTVAESLDKDRLKYPLMRNSLDQEFKRVSWDEALDRIVARIKKVRDTRGSDAICMYGSGQFQSEDYYIAQKLLKGCLGTNNFDANSRLCMSSAVSGYIQSLGSDGPPSCYEDLELTDCAFLIGTNTAECHPIVYNRLRMQHKKNRKVKMIVVDPRETKTAKDADLHLAIQPGTDIDLLNGIAHLLLRWGELDTLFIDECTQGFSNFTQVIKDYPPELVARRCGIRIDHLEQAARYWAESEKVLSLWSMGVNQSSEGTAKVSSIINLHLMTGNIGKPGAGPFSLTGQPNAMGGRETGGLSHLIPGYRAVKNPSHRAELEQAWQLPPGRINPVPGKDVWSMITGLETGDVGLFWVAATNPAVSMPDLVRTKKALLRSPFTIVQDAYYPMETASFAHVVLPAAQWGEKTGTMTNSERVVTLCSKFRQAPGEARPDWEIFAEVGRRLGFTKEFNFANSAQVYQEFVSLTKGRPCDMSGLSHGRLRQQGAIQWPCPLEEIDNHKLPNIALTCDTANNVADNSEPAKGLFSNLFKGKEETFVAKRLYTDRRFNTPDGRARFTALHSKGLAEPIDIKYPFVLTIGRLYEHWHTMTRTGRIEKIMKKQPQSFIEIHPRDAAKLGIEEQTMVEVRSRRGGGRFAAKITKAIVPGTVFVPMHWGALWTDNGEANLLTHPEACPISLQPELKACAVNLTPVKFEDSFSNHSSKDAIPDIVEKSMSV